VTRLGVEGAADQPRAPGELAAVERSSSTMDGPAPLRSVGRIRSRTSLFSALAVLVHSVVGRPSSMAELSHWARSIHVRRTQTV
jgi:hypothetical protein